MMKIELTYENLTTHHPTYADAWAAGIKPTVATDDGRLTKSEINKLCTAVLNILYQKSVADRAYTVLTIVLE